MLQFSSSDAGGRQRALERALANVLDVLIEPISGEAFVELATNPGTLYQVTATSCIRPAGQAGIPCQHRACYLAQIGELLLEPASRTCPSCSGGKIESWCAGHVIGFTLCPECQGTGRLDDDVDESGLCPACLCRPCRCLAAA